MIDTFNQLSTPIMWLKPVIWEYNGTLEQIHWVYVEV